MKLYPEGSFIPKHCSCENKHDKKAFVHKFIREISFHFPFRVETVLFFLSVFAFLFLLLAPGSNSFSYRLVRKLFCWEVANKLCNIGELKIKKIIKVGKFKMCVLDVNLESLRVESGIVNWLFIPR